MPSGMRTYIFFGLNAVRILSIIGLLLVFSSSVFVLVKDIQSVNAFQKGTQTGHATVGLSCEYIEGSTVPNQAAGVFWAVLNRLLIIFQVVMLFLSELGSPMVFFERFFPVLGPDFGLGPLGIFQALIGATVLSHHVDDFTLVSAFFLFSVGCLNMLLGLVFRGSARRRRALAAYREDTRSALLPSNATPEQIRAHLGGGLRPFHARGASVSTDGASVHSDDSTLNEKAGYGFGRQGEKSAAQKGYLISKPVEAMPRYAAPAPARNTTVSRFSEPSRYSHASADYDEEVPPVPEMPVPKFQSGGSAI